MREESARPSGSRTVGRTSILDGMSRSRTIRLTTATCWASFWPKYAASGRDDVQQLADDGADAREVPGAAFGALEDLGEAADAHGRREALGVDLARRRREQHVDAELARLDRVVGLAARVVCRSLASLNCAGLTNRLTTTSSISSFAARISEWWPAWKAPIVGTSPTDRFSARQFPSQARISAMVRIVLMPSFFYPPRRGSPRPTRPRPAGARACAARSWRDGARPCPRRRARSAPVSAASGPISAHWRAVASTSGASCGAEMPAVAASRSAQASRATRKFAAIAPAAW